MYIINDSSAPTLTNAPDDITIQCASSEPRGYKASTLTATDYCGLLSLTYTRSVSDSTCVNKKIVKHLWVALDSCMNARRDSQIVFINDNIPPTITNIPVNISIQCA